MTDLSHITDETLKEWGGLSASLTSAPSKRDLTVSWQECKGQEVGSRRRKQLTDTDALPDDLRPLVHEYGLPIITACVRYGVREPRQIHDLVREIWDGARQESQRGGSLNALDWLLIQAGANISAAKLIRFLKSHSLALVSFEPSHQMVEASMATVSQFKERVTKPEKHIRRLRAAILVGSTQYLSSQKIARAAAALGDE